MKAFIAKYYKSELMLAIIGIIATALSPKLGTTPEQLIPIISGIVAIVVGYGTGRSVAKPREKLAEAAMVEALALGKPEPSTEG